MSKKLRRCLSSLLAFVMLTSVMTTGIGSVAYAKAGEKIDVWDFGCVTESDTSIYNNLITVDTINGCEGIAANGKFVAGEYDFNGLTVNTVANDRMFCFAEGITKNYGTNAKAQTAYSDGYTANGMWYANGTGGDNRRFVALNAGVGDEVVIYTGASNTAPLSVHFTYMGTDGTQDDVAETGEGEMVKLSFVANYSGQYKIWYDKSVAGKPVINRVMRIPSTTVTGVISGLTDVATSSCTLVLKNTSTDDEYSVVIPQGENSFELEVTPGYTYSATLKGVTGYGLKYATKFVEVPIGTANGVSTAMEIEPKETYEFTGTIKGFDSSYDTSKLAVVLTPDSDETDTVKATPENLAFKATLEPDITYNVTLEGVNDYEITSGSAILFTNVKTAEQKIEVAPKTTYSVSGIFVTSDGVTPTAGTVTALVFTNLEDDYTYSATVDGNKYSVSLREGEYVASVSSEVYKTSTHVSVSGKTSNADLYLKTIAVAAPTVDTSVRDIYVGCDSKVNNYETIGEAFAAAAVMNPASEAERVTIHVASGTYREQTSLNTPYVSLVKEGTGEVVLTWYYGIGYKYYSAAATGYYDDESAFDSYYKKGPDKWGTATYIKSGATDFKAEGITFETSFNKYVTDEEIVDGVESDGSMSFVRDLGVTVTSKAATERATALSLEADRAEFKDCKFIGSQDTLYMGAPVRAYYLNCMIEGNTDYIFGSGNAIFDGCELRFAGYSDTAVGGYITAARADADKWTSAEVAYKGYLFRNCVITNKATDDAGNEMKSAAGYFGRPWDQNAAVTYANTILTDSDNIAAAGWTDMSGNTPDKANYKEYNTTYNGTAVDTTGRIAGTAVTELSVMDSDYFGTWTPSTLVKGTTPSFATAPYFSSDGDVLLPSTGDTLTVKYDLGSNAAADVSRIDWYRVKADDTKELIKTSSAVVEDAASYKLVSDDIDCIIRAEVTPITLDGGQADMQYTETVKEVVKGTGGGSKTERPSGKVAIFLAGDSTVKDYSAGAINNTTTRTEGSWGEFLDEFVSSDYVVRNYAQGGRSSRTFIDGTKEDGSDKYFDMIKSEMMAGDYLFIQFGHNDSSASYADRYVPTGTPDANGVYPATAPSSDGAGDGTFKWYLQYMIDAAKEVGATPVMVTPVSRMYFDDNGNIYSHHGDNDEYVTITKQVAEENGIECIDLYTYTKELYESAYADSVTDNGTGLTYPTALFAKGEKTHHSKVGGFIIAAQLALELKNNAALGLADSIVTPKSTASSNGEGDKEFTVWSNGVFEAYALDSEGSYTTDIDNYWSAYANELLEKINETVVEDFIWGDADKNGILTANDASVILQFVLDSSFDTEGIYDSSHIDLNNSGTISADDAAMVMQKTIDSTFVFPAEAA